MKLKHQIVFVVTLVLLFSQTIAAQSNLKKLVSSTTPEASKAGALIFLNESNHLDTIVNYSFRTTDLKLGSKTNYGNSLPYI